MNADGPWQEEMRMSRLINTARPRPVLVKPWRGDEDRVSTFASQCDDHESLTIPNRGIVFGSLLSGVLWAVLILVVREVWLYLR
jgi:hypothetical protein